MMKNGNVGEMSLLNLYYHEDTKDGDIPSVDDISQRVTVLRMFHENSYEEVLQESFKMCFESTESMGHFENSDRARVSVSTRGTLYTCE
jgi:hypothetical protein